MAAVQHSVTSLLSGDGGAGLQQLSEGIREEMMVAMLSAMQGTAAVCADICVQRMKSLHEQMLRELGTLEANAQRKDSNRQAESAMPFEASCTAGDEEMHGGDGGAALEAMYDDLDANTQGRAAVQDSCGHRMENQDTDPSTILEPSAGAAVVHALSEALEVDWPNAPSTSAEAQAVKPTAGEVAGGASSIDRPQEPTPSIDAIMQQPSAETTNEFDNTTSWSTQGIGRLNYAAVDLLEPSATAEHVLSLQPSVVSTRENSDKPADAKMTSDEVRPSVDVDTFAGSLDVAWPSEPSMSTRTTVQEPSVEAAVQESHFSTLSTHEEDSKSAEVAGLDEDALHVALPKAQSATDEETSQTSIKPGPGAGDQPTELSHIDAGVTSVADENALAGALDVDGPEDAKASPEAAAAQVPADATPKVSDVVTTLKTEENVLKSAEADGLKDALEVDCPKEPSATVEDAAEQPSVTPSPGEHDQLAELVKSDAGVGPCADVDALAGALDVDWPEDAKAIPEAAAAQVPADVTPKVSDVVTALKTEENVLKSAEADGLKDALEVDWPKEPSATVEDSVTPIPGEHDQLAELVKSDAGVGPCAEVDALAGALDVDWPEDAKAIPEAAAAQVPADATPKVSDVVTALKTEENVLKSAEADGLKDALEVDWPKEPDATAEDAAVQPAVTPSPGEFEKSVELVKSDADLRPCTDVDASAVAFDLDCPHETKALPETSASEPPLAAAAAAPAEAEPQTSVASITNGADADDASTSALDADLPIEPNTSAGIIIQQATCEEALRESDLVAPLSRNEQSLESAGVDGVNSTLEVDWTKASSATSEVTALQPSVSPSAEEFDPSADMNVNEDGVKCPAQGLIDGLDVDWPKEPHAKAVCAETQPSIVHAPRESDQPTKLSTTDAGVTPCSDVNSVAGALDVDWPEDKELILEAAGPKVVVETLQMDSDPLATLRTEEDGLKSAEVDGLNNASEVDWPKEPSATAEDAAVQPSVTAIQGEHDQLEDLGKSNADIRPCEDVDVLAGALDVDWPEDTKITLEIAEPQVSAEAWPKEPDSVATLSTEQDGLKSEEVDGLKDALEVDWPKETGAATEEAPLQPSPALNSEGVFNQQAELSTSDACARTCTDEDDFAGALDVTRPSEPTASVAGLKDALDVDWPNDPSITVETALLQHPVTEATRELDTATGFGTKDAGEAKLDVLHEALDIDWPKEPSALAEDKPLQPSDSKLQPVAVADAVVAEQPPGSAASVTLPSTDLPEDAWDFDWADETSTAKVPLAEGCAAIDKPSETLVTPSAKDMPEDAWDFDWADEANVATPAVRAREQQPPVAHPTAKAAEQPARTASIVNIDSAEALASAPDPWDDLDIDFSDSAAEPATTQGVASAAAQPVSTVVEDPFAEFSMGDLAASPLASRSAVEMPQASKPKVDDLDPFAEFTL